MPAILVGVLPEGRKAIKKHAHLSRMNWQIAHINNNWDSF